MTRIERSAKKTEIKEAIGSGIFGLCLVIVMIIYLCLL